MVKQIIIGGIVGGITLFMWGFISWVVLPWHYGTVKQHEGINTVVEDITEHVPESGVYYLPAMAFDHEDEQAMNDWEEMHRTGPRGYIFLQATPTDPMPPMLLVKGFAADVVASMMASLLLLIAIPSLPNYQSRVVFVAALGAFSILSVYLVDGIFHDFPLRYSLGLAADTAIAWVLAGITIAAVVRPKKHA